MMQSICHFVPYHKDYHSIHTINFVFEKMELQKNILKTETLYKMCYVCSGNGFLHTSGRINKISKGDIFFTFPATAFCIEAECDFSFMYISFIGTRGNMIMEKLGISNRSFIFHNCNDVADFWQKGLDMKNELMDLMSESVLLYTFSYLAEKVQILKNQKYRSNDTISVIKKYIDDNFSSCDFSLDNMSKELGYNKKYISATFKKNMNVGIVEYLKTVRVQQACTMMQQGFVSVTDISYSCGYDDPQYFSRVFKNLMGMSPAKYIKELKNMVL